jgi:hypothetical protein
MSISDTSSLQRVDKKHDQREYQHRSDDIFHETDNDLSDHLKQICTDTQKAKARTGDKNYSHSDFPSIIFSLYFEEKTKHLESVAHQSEKDKNTQDDTSDGQDADDQRRSLRILAPEIQSHAGQREKTDEFIHLISFVLISMVPMGAWEE